MSWLDDLSKERVFIYRFEDGETIKGTQAQLNDFVGHELKFDPGEEFEVDNRKASYAGFDPIKLSQRSSVCFEKNGRKAYANRDSDGNMTYISETKMNYLKTGKIENSYTDAYQEQVTKGIQAEIRESKRQQEDKTLQDAVRHLGDGEYVSDGKNFIRADQYEETIKSAKQKG